MYTWKKPHFFWVKEMIMAYNQKKEKRMIIHMEDALSLMMHKFEILKCYYSINLKNLKIKRWGHQTYTKTYFPWAVSPESMIASASSRTAIAMSETSALVGVGWFIILSSMFVATITGFCILWHLRIMSSCLNET